MSQSWEFTIAPGTLTALSGMDDNRAFFTLSGDLNQMGLMERALKRAGFPVVKNNVYPGFQRNQEEKYREALIFLYQHMIPGWWNQKRDLVKYGICSEEEFAQKLDSTR